MATQVKLTAESREPRGSNAAGRLRADGRVPAVLYGHDVDSATSVSLDGLDLEHALHTAAGMNALLDLELDGEQYLAFAREIQRHVVRGDIMHIDLYAVSKDQFIEVEIPIHLLNDDQVARETGGVVQQILRSVPIRVRPLEVPTALELDITGMTIGDVKRVEDLDFPPDAEVAIEPDRALVTVAAPDIIEEPEPEAEEIPILETLTEEELAELSEEERAALLEAAAEAEEEAAEEGEEFMGDEEPPPIE